MLGIVIDDVPSIRENLKTMLKDAGCERVVALGNTKTLISLLKKEPESHTVIVVSDLMDSKEAGKQRQGRAVIKVAEKRVKELVNARDVSPAVKIIVYSLAPTLAMAAGNKATGAKPYADLVRDVQQSLGLAQEDIVGKLGPDAQTFAESQSNVASRVQTAIDEAKTEQVHG